MTRCNHCRVTSSQPVGDACHSCQAGTMHREMDHETAKELTSGLAVSCSDEEYIEALDYLEDNG